MMFNFQIPIGYYWLIDQKLVGFEPFTSLQPWYFLKKDEIFSATEQWPEGPSEHQLVVFARRQDCDDLACFEVISGKVEKIIIIHGWTPRGYEIIKGYNSFWNWLKAVIDDIAEWAELET